MFIICASLCTQTLLGFHSRSTLTESHMDLTLHIADMPKSHLRVALQAMCGALQQVTPAAFNEGAPPGAMKNRRSSA